MFAEEIIQIENSKSIWVYTVPAKFRSIQCPQWWLTLILYLLKTVEIVLCKNLQSNRWCVKTVV